MPYKDAGKRKESNRLAMERSRKGTQRVHGKEGYTGETAIILDGVHIHRFVDGKREELKEVPEGYRVLSDGQVWEPRADTIFERTGLKELLHIHDFEEWLLEVEYRCTRITFIPSRFKESLLTT